MHSNIIKINNNKINLVFDYKYEKKKKNINRTKSPESDTAKYLTNPI
jgi:subtilisin-like proprotein convertase family protein